MAAAEHVGASGGMLTYHRAGGAEVGMVVGGLREDLTEKYILEYAVNRYAEAAAAVPEKARPYLASSLVDRRETRRSALYADILRPQRIENLAIIPHPTMTRGGDSGGVAFTLDERQADEAGAALARAAEVTPHLMRAIDLSLDLAAARPLSGERDLLEALASPSLLVNGYGAVLHANGAAAAMLSAGDPIAIVAPDRTIESPGAPRRLADAVRAAVGGPRSALGDRRHASSVRVPRVADGQEVLIAITPLTAGFQDIWTMIRSDPKALVQVVEPARSAARQVEALRAAVGLTPAEAQVVAMIAQGLSAADVARRLDLSHNTIRSHLSHAFDKIGVNSQASLARLVALVQAPAAS